MTTAIVRCDSCGQMTTVWTDTKPCDLCGLPWRVNQWLKESDALPPEKPQRTLKSRLLSGG